MINNKILWIKYKIILKNKLKLYPLLKRKTNLIKIKINNDFRKILIFYHFFNTNYFLSFSFILILLILYNFRECHSQINSKNKMLILRKQAMLKEIQLFLRSLLKNSKRSKGKGNKNKELGKNRKKQRNKKE